MLLSEPCLAIVATFTAGRTKSSRDTTTSSGESNFWTGEAGTAAGSSGPVCSRFRIVRLHPELTVTACCRLRGWLSQLTFLLWLPDTLRPPPPPAQSSGPFSLLSVICSRCPEHLKLAYHPLSLCLCLCVGHFAFSVSKPAWLVLLTSHPGATCEYT